jgi:hypothetical protein
MPPTKPIYGSNIASQPPKKKLGGSNTAMIRGKISFTTPFYLFLCEKLHIMIE